MCGTRGVCSGTRGRRPAGRRGPAGELWASGTVRPACVCAPCQAVRWRLWRWRPLRSALPQETNDHCGLRGTCVVRLRGRPRCSDSSLWSVHGLASGLRPAVVDRAGSSRSSTNPLVDPKGSWRAKSPVRVRLDAANRDDVRPFLAWPQSRCRRSTPSSSLWGKIQTRGTPSLLTV